MSYLMAVIKPPGQRGTREGGDDERIDVKQNVHFYWMI